MAIAKRSLSCYRQPSKHEALGIGVYLHADKPELVGQIQTTGTTHSKFYIRSSYDHLLAP